MEFGDLGAHCQHAGCNQKDFLPFRCDCCHKVFCLTHRSYRTHECPKAGSKDTHAIECPICAGSIRITGDEDPNVAFERHSKSACNPARRRQRKHKKRCGAPRCHKKLTLTNTFKCDDCGIEVCLDHRYGDAHKCPGAAGSGGRTQAKQSFLSRFTSSAKRTGSAGGHRAREAEAAKANRAAAAAKARRQKRQRSQAKPDPSNTLRGTAARRMQGRERAAHVAAAAPARSTAAATTATGATASAVPPSLMAGVGRGREVCPTCQARFESVTDLVSHVESWHATPTSTPSSAVSTPHTAAPAPATATRRAATASMPCPNCGASFFDAVALVNHCESGQCPHTRTRRQSSCLVS